MESLINLWSFELSKLASLRTPIRWLMLCFLGFHAPAFSEADSARELFGDSKQSILQIRVVDIASGSKSAIGSGFVVDNSGLIVTNYHVIERESSQPDQYRVEYLTSAKQAGELRLVDVDVVNDLALLQATDIQLKPLILAAQEPEVGMPVYALGNPLDLGLTVVPGTYNGIIQGSYRPRVHFTGSINSGMSGGPALDANGRIMGINVASAGNQMGFLVPVRQLQLLLDQYTQQEGVVADMKIRIGEQLMEDQNKKFSELFDVQWQSISLGEAEVLKELAPFVKCWGGSNSADEKSLFLSADRTCRSQDNIYLNSRFNTGSMEYQFFWLQANQLQSGRFYTYYEKLFQDFVPGNRANEEDVTNFECKDGFTQSDTGRQYKTVLCLRAYKDYPDLYDVLFLQGTVDDSARAFVSHFTLAGVSKPNSQQFAQRFMEYSQWR